MSIIRHSTYLNGMHTHSVQGADHLEYKVWITVKRHSHMTDDSETVQGSLGPLSK